MNSIDIRPETNRNTIIHIILLEIKLQLERIQVVINSPYLCDCNILCNI